MIKTIHCIILLMLLQVPVMAQETTEDLLEEHQKRVEQQKQLFTKVDNNNISFEVKLLNPNHPRFNYESIRITGPKAALKMLEDDPLEAIVNHLREDDEQDYAAYLMLCDLANIKVNDAMKTLDLNYFKTNKATLVAHLDDWIEHHTTW